MREPDDSSTGQILLNVALFLGTVYFFMKHFKVCKAPGLPRDHVRQSFAFESSALSVKSLRLNVVFLKVILLTPWLPLLCFFLRRAMCGFIGVKYYFHLLIGPGLFVFRLLDFGRKLRG